MGYFDLRLPDHCLKYIVQIEKNFQQSIGPDHKLYWLIDGKEKFINDLNEKEIIKIAEDLSMKAPYFGPIQ